MLRDLFASLAPFKPLLAGTYPLGLNIESSDLDVICEAPDLDELERALTAQHGNAPGFAVHRVPAQPPAVVASFQLGDSRVEVFGQAVASHRQAAFRHMMIEGRLLRLASEGLREEIIARKRAGDSTEAAFASALALSGDPFEAVLALEPASDDELVAVLARRGFSAASPEVATPASSAEASTGDDAGVVSWGKIFTESVPNPRMAHEELERQLDALRAELNVAEKMDIARRLKMKPESLRLTNPVTEFGVPDEVLGLYRWCNGGELAVGQRRFSPLLRMHEIREYMIQYAIPHFLPTCIPLAVDGKGNCYFIDLSTKPSPWVRFGPLDRLGMRDKFRLIADSFPGMFADGSDPADW